MSDEEDLPRPRPVEVREVVEPPSPWPSVKEVVTNLLLVFGGGALIWLVVDRLGAPTWVAFVALMGIWVAGTVAVRLLRRRRSAAAAPNA
ncbi:hypothetical protein [Frigoribacterium sp. PvP032]|uniref:hypothetical protein n=1 Tax=Frigoribacterium sp. PvP032 TaxID=2806589 RepID=UPI001AE3B6C1|nr:hypothetical protein [Frigoribacterium sp. PvP032]MBP1189214.1 Flp pilus assembly protein TadB [Frigoribacterium sp. PvP032]